jgi:radical SAM superfamily enzyme YgiQ (UPF0313 family)
MRKHEKHKITQLPTDDCDEKYLNKDKLLLLMLPFWTPLIPPQGIASLKSFLQKHGYNVKTVDANVEEVFKEIFEMYFGTLREFVPENKRGNFFRVGDDVLRNHMMAHLNYTDKHQYSKLIKSLIYKTYYIEVNLQLVSKLNSILDEFYIRLERYFLDLLETEKPTVVGFSTTVSTLPASMFACKLTKERYRDIMTVIGGALFVWGLHQSPDFDLFLKMTPYIDKIIIGEGENLLLKLLQNELPNSQRVYSLEDIEGKTVDISSMDIPIISDFHIHQYPYLSAFGSISCPFNCSFCTLSNFYGKYRRKNVKRVVEEMITLYKTFKSQVFLMNDLLINPIVSELAKEFIKADISLDWDALLRVEESVGDPENTLLWRRGGLYRARMGVESGSQRVLDLMKKKITVEQSKTAISSLAYSGIKTSAFVIVGFPGETEDDFQKTLDLITELKNDIWEVDCTPFMYHYTGQGNSDEWAHQRRLLYPSEFRDMLVTQSWILNSEPSREETYRRMNQLVGHCKEMGISNPFSLNEHYQADERWKKLHENAVPGLIDFKSNEYINETKNVKKFFWAQNTTKNEGDFVF